MLSLICIWINDWVNNREAGDLRRHRARYDVIVMVGAVPHINIIRIARNIRKYNQLWKKMIQLYKVAVDLGSVLPRNFTFKAIYVTRNLETWPLICWHHVTQRNVAVHRPENCSLFADEIFKCVFLKGNAFEFWVEFHCNLFARFQFDNKPAMVHIMAWRRTGDKPLS